MKKQPFLWGVVAGIGIFYFLKKVSPKKRNNKKQTQIKKKVGEKI